MPDMRSPLAKARDDWFAGVEGKRVAAEYPAKLEAQFLKSRLETAFIAGWEASRQWHFREAMSSVLQTLKKLKSQA